MFVVYLIVFAWAWVVLGMIAGVLRSEAAPESRNLIQGLIALLVWPLWAFRSSDYIRFGRTLPAAEDRP